MELEPTEGIQDSTAWRLAQFKSPGQSFKDRVRQRCIQRIKKDRFSAVAERRSRSTAANGQWNSPVTARGGGQAELGAPSAQGVGAPAQRFGCPAQESRGFGVSAHAVRRFGAAQGGVGVVAAFGLTAQGFGAAPAAQRSHQSGPAAAGPAPQPSTVAAVLAEEWSAAQCEAATAEGYDHAWMERVYDELQAELMHDEQQIIAQYDAAVGREEEAASMEAMLAEQEQAADAVICPICVKNWLHHNRAVIFCACGFRVDTESDGTTLRSLKHTIDRSVDGHARVCGATPVFSLDPQLRMMVMRCKTCGHMNIVL